MRVRNTIGIFMARARALCEGGAAAAAALRPAATRREGPGDLAAAAAAPPHTPPFPSLSVWPQPPRPAERLAYLDALLCHRRRRGRGPLTSGMLGSAAVAAELGPRKLERSSLDSDGL